MIQVEIMLKCVGPERWDEGAKLQHGMLQQAAASSNFSHKAHGLQVLANLVLAAYCERVHLAGWRALQGHSGGG